MKNYHPITLLMLASGILQSQDVSKILKEPWERDYLINGEARYSYKKNSACEAGVNFSKYNMSYEKVLSENVLFLSAELQFAGQKVLIAPKAGYGLYLLPYNLKGAGLHVRCSGILSGSEHVKAFLIQPEAGITFLGIVTLSYVYSRSLSKNKIQEIPSHGITIGFHFGYYRSLMTVLSMSGGMVKRFNPQNQVVCLNLFDHSPSYSF
jgi:hypothetical protein